MECIGILFHFPFMCIYHIDVATNSLSLVQICTQAFLHFLEKFLVVNLIFIVILIKVLLFVVACFV